MATVDGAIRLDRTRLRHLRQKAEGGCSARLRSGADDLPVVRFQHHRPRRYWCNSYRCPVFRENLRRTQHIREAANRMSRMGLLGDSIYPLLNESGRLHGSSTMAH